MSTAADAAMTAVHHQDLWQEIRNLPVSARAAGDEFVSLVCRISGEDEAQIRRWLEHGLLPYAFLARTAAKSMVPPPAVGMLLDLMAKHPEPAVREFFAALDEPLFETDDELLTAYDATREEFRRSFSTEPADDVWPAGSVFRTNVGCCKYGQH